MTAEQTHLVRLGVIGGGFMGEAIIDGLLRAGVVRAQDLAVGETLEHRRQHLSRAFDGVQVVTEAADAAAGREVVLIGVKPQDFPKVAKSLKGRLRPEQLVLSIMAGTRLAVLSEALTHAAVVRVMPNTPASLGLGFSTWVAAPAVSAAQREQARRILGALGLEAEVGEERYVDMATAVAGSGPAYVFLFLEALIDGAVHIGLPRGLAREMVLQTVLGSVKMASATDRHPAELRDMVTSPGGTTAAGLLALEQSSMRATVTEAIIAAFDRSRALGG